VERIREGFARIVASGGQIIAATHHPLIMRDATTIELVSGYTSLIQQTLCGKDSHA